MRFLISILAIMLLGGILSLVSPWWIVVPLALAVNYLARTTAIGGFLAGFLGVSLLWAAVAFWIDLENGALLSQKMAQLFSLSGGGPLIAVTAVLGGIVGGMSGLSGSLLGQTLRRKNR